MARTAKATGPQMKVVAWSGRKWRGQRYYCRIIDAINGQTLFTSEAYLAREDRDHLVERCVGLGMELVELP